ncbi:MAG: hypothetical protein WBA10_01705 [Elainellaceae cyanobacterium]
MAPNPTRSIHPDIHIHIDRIVLDGLNIPPSQRDRLRQSICEGLAALLTEHVRSGQTLPSQLVDGANLSGLSVDVAFAPDGAVSAGQQISQAIYGQAIAEQSHLGDR